MLRLLELRLGFNRLDLDQHDSALEDSALLKRVIKQSTVPSPVRTKKERRTATRSESALIVPLREISPKGNLETKEEMTKCFWKFAEDGDIVALLNVLHRSENNSKFLARARNEYGNSCVMYCCWGLSHDPQLLRLLLDSGAAPDIINAEGSTPLHECCISGKIEMAKILLEYPQCRALIDHRDDLRRRRTPLVCAVGYGHTHIARLLLENGASSESSLPVQIGCRYKQYHGVLAMLEHNESHLHIIEEQWPELCHDEKVVGLVRWKRRKEFVMCLAVIQERGLKEQEDGEEDSPHRPPHRLFYVRDLNYCIASYL